MNVQITDLMDLYEDKSCLLDTESLDPAAEGSTRKEGIPVKERKARFGWKEGLALAAALGAAVLGGLCIRSYLRREQSPAATQTPTLIMTEPLPTEPVIQASTEPGPESPEEPLADRMEEVNALLTAFAQQGVESVYPDLSGEYELLSFAHIYAKHHQPEALEYRQDPEGGSYELLPLETANRILTKLLGRSVDPEEGTDYSLLRGDNYAQHQFFREGAYWSPAADGDIPTRFALAYRSAPGEGDSWIVEFTVFEADLSLWPDFPDASMAELLAAVDSSQLAEKQVFQVGLGRASLREGSEGLQVVSYNAWTQGTPGDETLQAELQALVGDYGSWYSRALNSRYAAPEQLDLYAFFYNGIPGVPEPTPEEAAIEFQMFPSLRYPHTGLHRLPRAEMDKVLLQYFGLSLAETEQRGLYPMYVEQTDCWFHEHGDTNAASTQILGLRVLEDGRILLLHDGSAVMSGPQPDTLWTAGLKPVEGGYQFLFNLPGEWTTPEQAGDFYPLQEGDTWWRSIQRDPDGAHVTRELDFNTDGSLLYREGDRDSEFSFWAEGGWWLQAGKLHVQIYETDEYGQRKQNSGAREAVFTGGAKGAGGLVLIQESETGFAASRKGWSLDFTRQPAPDLVYTCTEAGTPIDPGLQSQLLCRSSMLHRILQAGAFARPQDIRLGLMLLGGLGDYEPLSQEELAQLQALAPDQSLSGCCWVLWSDLDPLLEQWLGVSREQLTDWTGVYTLPGRERCYVGTVPGVIGWADLSFRALRELGDGMYQLEYGRLDQDADKEIIWTANLRQTDDGWQVLSNLPAAWND